MKMQRLIKVTVNETGVIPTRERLFNVAYIGVVTALLWVMDNRILEVLTAIGLLVHSIGYELSMWRLRALKGTQ